MAALTVLEWNEIRAYFGDHCAYCLRKGRMTKDHIVPIVKGGSHSASNVVPACVECNSSKGKKTLLQFAARPVKPPEKRRVLVLFGDRALAPRKPKPPVKLGGKWWSECAACHGVHSWPSIRAIRATHPQCAAGSEGRERGSARLGR